MRYSEFCNKSQELSENEKTFASVIANDYKSAIKNFIDQGEYEDAKILWLKSISQTKESESNPFFMEEGTKFFNSEEIERKITGLKFDDQSSEIVKITRLIATDYLIQGYPILAAGTYISIKDFFNTFKVLVQANEIDIAYLLIKTLKIKTPFEREIVLGLCFKELKNKNVYIYLL